MWGKCVAAGQADERNGTILFSPFFSVLSRTRAAGPIAMNALGTDKQRTQLNFKQTWNFRKMKRKFLGDCRLKGETASWDATVRPCFDDFGDVLIGLLMSERGALEHPTLILSIRNLVKPNQQFDHCLPKKKNLESCCLNSAAGLHHKGKVMYLAPL